MDMNAARKAMVARIFDEVDEDKSGHISPDELEQALASGILTGREIDQCREPVVGDELQVLPGVQLNVDGTEYYREGDKGRVSQTVDEDTKFEIYWYRTGLTSTMKTAQWLQNFRPLGKCADPKLGEEVQCLEKGGLTIEGREYYQPGDKGRVSRESYVGSSDNLERIEITWYRTGLTTTMLASEWFRNFRLVDIHLDTMTIEELRQEIASLKEKLAAGTHHTNVGGNIEPHMGDEMEALPGTGLNVDGKLYYESGDKGRVSAEKFATPSDGIERFEITWYRTGLTSTMKSSMWLKNLRFLRKGVKHPSLGDELQCLPGHGLLVADQDYYTDGDKGRVSKESSTTASDGVQRFEVTWYRTGLTSTMKSDVWYKNFCPALQDTLLVDADQSRLIEDAMPEVSGVSAGKPMELITGQPKSAAMGLYHFMRVKDPFAEEGTSKIKEEISRFVTKMKDNAALVTLLETAEHRQAEIERVYGEARIAEAKEEITYFKGASRLPATANALDVAKKVEEEVLDNLSYILDEECSEVYVEGPNAIRDKGRKERVFADFMKHENVKDAELTSSHVAALRLYTTPAYKYMNAPLRSQRDYYDKDKPHPLPVTVAYIAEGIKKLRAAYAVKVEAKKVKSTMNLWRGLKQMTVSDSFFQNQRGGTELAPMSTTSDCRVAAKYAASGESVLLKIKLDNFMQYGAELKWLSAFPGEDEVLYPPLTYLQPTGRDPQILELPSGYKFTVYEVRPTIP